jgi:hypothetical protein
MDVSNYGIRVIRLKEELTKTTIHASSKLPIDVEGSLLRLTCVSSNAYTALFSKDWFKVFFGGLAIHATVRWDNDRKGIISTSQLAICSLGTLPMCWPLYAPSKDMLSHRFDNRRAEERLPVTISVEPIEDSFGLIDIELDKPKHKIQALNYKNYTQRNQIKTRHFVKSYTTGNMSYSYSDVAKNYFDTMYSSKINTHT